MAKRTQSGDKILLDQLFAVPEGAEEVFTKDLEQSEIDIEIVDITTIADDFGEGYYDNVDYEDDGEDPGNEVVILTPEQFVVFAQILRRAPGGQMVVDVVLAIEDVPGAVSYEVQVSKA